MRTVTPGRTGLRVTPIRYGTWQFGGDWGSVDERAAVESIRAARDLGINFFDTAHGYGFGVSERLLGRALAAELGSGRDSVVIATKGGLRLDGRRLVRDSSPSRLRQEVEESLSALGTDHIDLIVDSRRHSHPKESVGALDLELSGDDIAEIDRLTRAAAPVRGPSPFG
ncbi:aldo/keto reductase [Spongiactinospora sp. TRM90649]|uniref:aldo/keto reductase n=1 Tax=Spongiactinospora sp. TRM90649 TaxID=3031114 RepID=UPI0023F91CD0|nr:aldo/keto reductase [Spongiactinospora sp. TRM90649]MDF5752052.1 aldo/keto reductase [Spongiactinospora sp. TRM90649]